MKKLFALLLCVCLGIALCSAAQAGSIDVVRGAAYIPTAQSTTITSAENATVWTDATYLAPYVKRGFVFDTSLLAGLTVAVTVEASIDNSDWAPVDASLTGLTSAENDELKLTDYPYPYWRIIGVTNTAGTGTLEVHSSQITM